MALHYCEECDAYLSNGTVCPECCHYNVPITPFIFQSFVRSLIPYLVIMTALAILAYCVYLNVFSQESGIQ